MKIKFRKYHGTGNDFIIIDDPKSKIELTTEQVRFLCSRHIGIGADGLIIIRPNDALDFEMVYYNSDGNLASFCGNGSRCAVQFYSKKRAKTKVLDRQIQFLASDGNHDAMLLADGQVSVKMKDIESIIEKDGDFILDTGSPHFVREVPDLARLDVVTMGRAVRERPQYGKEGINVNFFEELDKETVKIRTYERGVEDETLSCGTGMTAVAAVQIKRHFSELFEMEKTISLYTEGGEANVRMRIEEDAFRDIWLTGPAVQTYKGSIKI